MIQPVQNRLPELKSKAVADPTAAALQVTKHWHQELEQWVRERPGLALALAATAGAGLAWLIKRRT